MPSPFWVAVLTVQTLTAHGLKPRPRSALPPKVREHARTLKAYRGARKGYKAWRRFERVCAAEAARRAELMRRIEEMSKTHVLVLPRSAS